MSSALPLSAKSGPPLDAALDLHDPIEQLFWENDDSFEVPDFHFDWGVAKDNKEKPVDRGLRTLRLETRVVRDESPLSSGAGNTPSSQGTQSMQSSASSGHILSSTNASATSSASLAPSPPHGERSFRHPTSPSRAGQLDRGGEQSNPRSNRAFNRVVSAPLSRASRYSGHSDVVDLSASASTSTSTMRPALTHTSSTSSIPGEGSAEVMRNHFVTPGLTERTLISTKPSTGRRLGGLSRFGGPARRGVHPVDAPSETDSLSYDLPHDSTPPARASGSSTPQKFRQSPNQIHNRHNSPSFQQDGAALSQIQESRATRDPPLSHSSTDVPTSAFQTAVHVWPIPEPSSRSSVLSEQENRVTSSNPSYDHLKVDRAAPTAQASAIWDRPPPQPLRPSHTVPRTSPSPPSHLTSSDALRASRDPPAKPDKAEQQALLQTLPTPRALPPPEAVAQNTTLPIQSTHGGKRSFIVNGSPYERVGILGKGGSSKVYSVLCPTKRVIYALKRVALERADAETYQSYTNEIELLKRLRGHDRIIQLIDHQITFTPGNRPKMLMMVMECGEIDFAMLLDEQRGRRLNTNFVGLYWEQMLEAVHAVHLENVVHTDLKPANFVLVKGRLKIIDFGIAKAVANDTVNIQRDQQVGTVNYMSPEAIQRMNNQKVLKVSLFKHLY
ncbi:hypothetical protein BCR39DRAFT_541804 [Naematelia encephala]|uniref:Protein kinase domain-containing protein n=1 Tax=Naematelia encephala TaxID=71784 RepID=A0A1Y2AWJ0_9TREE|nr:hypothetical protein BCR39DRAFT_541804 [Naematelia encephala]